MNRRDFLLKGMKGILATGIAPYVVTTAGVLMPVRQILIPPQQIIDQITREYLDKCADHIDEMLRLDETCRQAIEEITGVRALGLGLPPKRWFTLELKK